MPTVGFQEITPNLDDPYTEHSLPRAHDTTYLWHSFWILCVLARSLNWNAYALICCGSGVRDICTYLGKESGHMTDYLEAYSSSL